MRGEARGRPQAEAGMVQGIRRGIVFPVIHGVGKSLSWEFGQKEVHGILDLNTRSGSIMSTVCTTKANRNC